MTEGHAAERNVFSSRSALVAGFGGLLLIMAGAGFEAIRTLQQVRRAETRIRAEFLSNNRLLNEVRSDLYLSGTYVRDYLLDPDPRSADRYGARVEEVRGKMTRALATYGEQSTNPEQERDYSELRSELARYWAAIEPILSWTPTERRSRGYVYLRDQIFPRRAAMMDLAGKVETINDQQLSSGEEQVEALLDQFRNRLIITLAAAMTLGIGMAAFSTRTILRLEGASHERFLQVAEARRQLTNLSAKLVEAQESERRALSRELHDEVGQSLSAVLVELRNLSAGLETHADEQTRGHVDTIKSLVEGTVRVVRNMALLLRPSMLDDLGLIPALRWQAREVSKQTDMEVTVATETLGEELPDEYKTCIYRIVQEALHNCARHSKASAVRVKVHQSPEAIVLSVQDDGCGFDVSQSKGMGLLGIEERVAQLGGTCSIHSGLGNGTMITVQLPYASPVEREKREADSYSISG